MKVDLHVHTSEVSACAQVCAKDVVHTYHRAGYDGIVITDHLQSVFGRELPTWAEKVSQYLRGFQAAKEEGDRIGLSVFFGCELRFDANANDYLVYGMDADFLLEHPYLERGTIEQFRSLIAGREILVFQAHPFRNDMTVTRPELLDGIEINNGCIRHDSRNSIAQLWAHLYGLAGISGSDYHRVGDEGSGGVVFEREVADEHELVRALKEGRYGVIFSSKKN